MGWVFSVRENGNEMSTFIASEVGVKFSVQSAFICGVNRTWEPGHSLYDKNPSYLQTTLSIERLGFHTTHHCTHIIFSFFQLYSPSGSFLTCLRLPLLGPVFWNIILLFVHVISLSKLYLVVLVLDLITNWLQLQVRKELKPHQIKYNSKPQNNALELTKSY